MVESADVPNTPEAKARQMLEEAEEKLNQSDVNEACELYNQVIEFVLTLFGFLFRLEVTSKLPKTGVLLETHF